MAEVIFYYKGISTTINCNLNDKMEEIINLFLITLDEKDKNLDLKYLYQGISIKKDLTINEQIKDLDKKRKRIIIIVNNNSKTSEKKLQNKTNESNYLHNCNNEKYIDKKNYNLKESKNGGILYYKNDDP